MGIIKKIIAVILCFSMFYLAGCGNNNAPQLVSDAKLSSSSYSLGDYMGDYTVIDINGNSYKFSELLKSKKAIVLNFWYINCGPCQMEFPYLQSAADEYTEDIAVIAINPTTDNEKDIKKYATQNELTIPLVKGDEAWINALELKGFPTTVVIDSYGNVAFLHMGAITENSVFEKIFEFFSNDDYEKSIIGNINDIR